MIAVFALLASIGMTGVVGAAEYFPGNAMDIELLIDGLVPGSLAVIGLVILSAVLGGPAIARRDRGKHLAIIGLTTNAIHALLVARIFIIEP